MVVVACPWRNVLSVAGSGKMLVVRCVPHKKIFFGCWLGLALILFGYGVGVATAIGRIVFWDNVYALRYQNIVLLFWIGVVLWLAGSVRWRNMGLVLGSVLLLVVFATQVGWYHDLTLKKTGNRTRNAHLALVVGLEDQLSAISATVSRSHLGKDSTYTLQREAAFARASCGCFCRSGLSNFPCFVVVAAIACVCNRNSWERCAW